MCTRQRKKVGASKPQRSRRGTLVRVDDAKVAQRLDHDEQEADADGDAVPAVAAAAVVGWGWGRRRQRRPLRRAPTSRRLANGWAAAYWLRSKPSSSFAGTAVGVKSTAVAGASTGAAASAGLASPSSIRILRAERGLSERDGRQARTLEVLLAQQAEEVRCGLGPGGASAPAQRLLRPHRRAAAHERGLLQREGRGVDEEQGSEQEAQHDVFAARWPISCSMLSCTQVKFR